MKKEKKIFVYRSELNLLSTYIFWFRWLRLRQLMLVILLLSLFTFKELFHKINAIESKNKWKFVHDLFYVFYSMNVFHEFILLLYFSTWSKKIIKRNIPWNQMIMCECMLTQLKYLKLLKTIKTCRKLYIWKWTWAYSISLFTVVYYT